MLKLIAGKKGTGKTKQLISMVNSEVEVSSGKVACIEKGTKLTYDINHSARLLDTEGFKITSYDALYGFIAGIAASDYDCKDIFVDSITKIAGTDFDKIGDLLDRINDLCKDDIKVVITISADPSELPESVKKYI